MRRISIAISIAAIMVVACGQTLAQERSNQRSNQGTSSNQGQQVPTTETGPDQRGQRPAMAPLPDTTAVQATPPAKPLVPAEDVSVAEQLRDLIENKLQHHVSRQQDRAGIDAFYRNRDFAPLWVSDAKPLPRVQQAADFLRGVAADGLDPADYPIPRFADTDPARLAADELAMTNSVMTFVRHASTGRVAFTRASASVYFDLKAPDPAQVLAQIAASGNVAGTLDSFSPQHPHYKALKAELATSRRSDPGRVDMIVANMERWRWLPRDLGRAHVMVNVPDYTLRLVDDGKAVWSTRIVVGKPGTYATPLLTETMKYITVNPTWNVPPSIIRNEYLPALARDPNALARVGLRLGRNGDGSLRVYQPPGERNALGHIRFNFPNRFLVYQHDTPQKHLFDKTARAFSHGCMRVQDPDRYAEVLLSVSQPEDGYTAKRIRSLYGADERTINFKNPIPVHVTYQTMFVDDAGRWQVRPDIYGLDKEIIGLLKGDKAVADIPVARNYSTSSAPVMASAVSGRRQRAGADGFFGAAGGWGRPTYMQSWPAESRERHGVW